MATTKLIIREKKQNKDGECVIFVRYTHNQKSLLVSTGEKIDPNFWEPAEEKVRKSFRGFTSLNAAIEFKENQVKTIANIAKAAGIEPTIEYMREALQLHKPKIGEVNKDFFKLYETFIENSSNTRAYNTLRQHRTTINHLKDFQAAKQFKITLESITIEFYERFTNYLISEKSQTPNTIGNWIKNLKIFLSYLTELGINENLTYKSKQFKKPSAKTEIIYLTKNEIDKIYHHDFSKNPKLERVRDIFIFECFTSLRYSDLANLKPENIKANHIEFSTIKTRDSLRIPLTATSKQILAKYDGALPKVMSNQKMNDYLKEVGKACEINELIHQTKYVGSKRKEYTVPKYELITTHTARRTFITQSLERGLRPEIIMKITGHKDIKTMMRYVKITDKVVDNEMLRAWDDTIIK